MFGFGKMILLTSNFNFFKIYLEIYLFHEYFSNISCEIHAPTNNRIMI